MEFGLGLAFAAAPLLAAFVLVYYYSTPKVILLRLCRRPWNPSIALRAKKLIEKTPALMPVAMLRNPNQLDIEECERRILSTQYNQEALGALNLRRCLAFMADQHALKAELNHQKQAFDQKDAAHVALLRQLWSLFYSHKSFRMLDDAWVRLGFQGSDPTADFRQMGCLALREIIYFSSALHEEAVQMIDEWDASTDKAKILPFALTAINASAWLWTLLQDGRLDRCFYIRGASLQTYRTLFCEILCGFLRAWKSEGCSSVLDFQRVSRRYLMDVNQRLDGTAEAIATLYI